MKHSLPGKVETKAVVLVTGSLQWRTKEEHTFARKHSQKCKNGQRGRTGGKMVTDYKEKIEDRQEWALSVGKEHTFRCEWQVSTAVSKERDILSHRQQFATTCCCSAAERYSSPQAAGKQRTVGSHAHTAAIEEVTDSQWKTYLPVMSHIEQ